MKFDFRQEGVLRASVLFLTVIIIGFLYPSKVKFRYEFHEGQVWSYDDLTAPFDYPILKTESELEAEKKLIKEENIPFYNFDDKVVDIQLARYDSLFRLLNNDFDMAHYSDFSSNQTKYRVFGGKLLRELFTNGIIESRALYELEESKALINLVRGDEISLVAFNNFLTLDQARIFVDSQFESSKLEDIVLLSGILNKLLVPNILFDESMTKRVLQQKYNSLSLTKGMVSQGDPIISKGGLITSETYKKLLSYKFHFDKEIAADKSNLGLFLGYFMFTLMIMIIFFTYLKHYHSQSFSEIKNFIFLCVWIIIYSFIVSLVEGQEAISPYIIPFAIIPIVLRNFFNFYLSFVTLFVILMIGSFITSMGYEFTMLHIVAGFVALISSYETRYWSNFFLTILYVFITYSISFAALCLVQDGYISEFELRQFGWFAGNAFLTLLAYPLIPLVERFFNYTSSITLAELSDLNRPLLKELSMRAPGTFQHSLQVANLAEAAAAKVNANALLIKVAALYHDVGKMKHPQYFIENQTGSNPHRDLSPKKSAAYIIEHVEEGVQMARQNRLPSILMNFIKTHHGTTRVEYFYRLAIEKYGVENVLEADFTYPGPKPKTKEETILMLADSIEAASKSLTEYTDESIESLVDRIIAFKIDQRQLELSELSFKEIRKCATVFKKMLRSIYHVRIKYPAKEEENPD